MKKERIGLLGTGLMGKPMAERILIHGYPLLVYNRTRPKTRALKDAGATVAATPGGLWTECDIFISLLADYSANLASIGDDSSRDLKGKMFIMMGTVSPRESLQLKAEVNKRNGNYLEAPVLGSIPQVKSGSLMVFAGGDRQDYLRVKSLLKIFGPEVKYIGETGKATALKLAFNHLIASLTHAFGLSLGYIRNSGIEVEEFMEILKKSALYAPTYDKKLGRMLTRDFTNPNFPLRHMLKDVNLMVEAFSSQRLNVNALQGLKCILQQGIQQGLEDLDYSAMYNVIHPE